jgi:hypothetical protein
MIEKRKVRDIESRAGQPAAWAADRKTSFSSGVRRESGMVLSIQPTGDSFNIAALELRARFIGWER